MYKFLVALSTLIFQSEDPSVNAEQTRDNFLSRIVVRFSNIVLFDNVGQYQDSYFVALVCNP